MIALISIIAISAGSYGNYFCGKHGLFWTSIGCDLLVLSGMLGLRSVAQ